MQESERSMWGARGVQGLFWLRILKGAALLSLVTMLFLFVPAMQGTGFSAGSDDRHSDPAAAALDRAAREAVTDIAEPNGYGQRHG